MIAGNVCHIEIAGKDTAKVKKFFSSLFGWKFQSSMPGYDTYSAGDGAIGGGLWSPPEGVPHGIVNYILVQSVNDHAKKIASAGGKILVPKSEVPGMGWFAVFADPEGNRWGIWETNPKFMAGQDKPQKPAARKPARPAAKTPAKPAASKPATGKRAASKPTAAKKKGKR